MVFRLPFALNIEYERIHWPDYTIWCVADTFPLLLKPKLKSIAAANMQWGHFACPSCSQNRENTAFELVLQSTWGLSSPHKQVARSSTPCWKRSQVWGTESERWPKYMH